MRVGGTRLLQLACEGAQSADPELRLSSTEALLHLTDDGTLTTHMGCYCYCCCCLLL